MAKRTLKRQLGLFQVIMLGTAGAIASEIFVLTGHAVGIAGPAAFLAILIGGVLSFSIALNYSELATVYPETGGALTYVREAWGKGLLSFLVGSMDSISSTFYCALSAIGFAYSLSVFFPGVPIVPAAIGVIILFTLLNVRGVSNVGNTQLVLGGILVVIFGIYIIYGFVSPTGFHVTTFLPEGKLFIGNNGRENFASLMKTIALVYAAYVGFEVIADDAEEIKKPNKNIPIGILVSLGLITAIYSLTMLVTVGTIPWQQLAGSETSLTDAISRFMPNGGVAMMAFAGLVATLTSVNSSMLSATREAFTLSRDGHWPQVLSHLNRFRTPFVSIIFIGAVSALITSIGVVDFLSFITSAGYLFVLFFSNLAMIQLRKKYPAINRPFKVPFFPLTPLLASFACLLVIAYSDIQPLMFTGGVILIFALYYFARNISHNWTATHHREVLPGRSRIILPVVNSHASDGLMAISSVLAEAEMDSNLCLLSVLPSSAQVDDQLNERYLEKIRHQRQAILEKFIHYAVERNVPMYTKMVAGVSMADGIIHEARADSTAKLLLLNWPDAKAAKNMSKQSVKRVIEESNTSVGIFADRGITDFSNIMVPVGGGMHSQMAIHLANDIATRERSHVDYFRVLPAATSEEEGEDEMAYLQEIVMTELGEIPANAAIRMIYSDSISAAVIKEARANPYDLIIIGSSEENGENNTLFGAVSDEVAENASCSVLVVKRHMSQAASWLRKQVRRF